LPFLLCRNDACCHVSENNENRENKEAFNWDEERKYPAATNGVCYFFPTKVQKVD
jgi:hypothetical protein